MFSINHDYISQKFKAGPRVCLGQNFALIEMKCFIAKLISRFDFNLAQDKDSVTYDNSLTLPIKSSFQSFTIIFFLFNLIFYFFYFIFIFLRWLTFISSRN